MREKNLRKREAICVGTYGKQYYHVGYWLSIKVPSHFFYTAIIKKSHFSNITITIYMPYDTDV